MAEEWTSALQADLTPADLQTLCASDTYHSVESRLLQGLYVNPKDREVYQRVRTLTELDECRQKISEYLSRDWRSDLDTRLLMDYQKRVKEIYQPQPPE